jgi:catechol 2,3-dioxygenase-like lactoylglutathione lyase family enzyme
MKQLYWALLSFAIIGCRDIEAKPQQSATGDLSMSTTPSLLTHVSTIVLGVKDVAQSIAFYRDILGLELKGQSENLAFISIGSLTLMLNRELGDAVSPRAGATEIVFAVTSVSSTYEVLRAKGCTFINQPREVTAGTWAASFKDPDGHLLTLFGPC